MAEEAKYTLFKWIADFLLLSVFLYFAVVIVQAQSFIETKFLTDIPILNDISLISWISLGIFVFVFLSVDLNGFSIVLWVIGLVLFLIFALYNQQVSLILDWLTALGKFGSSWIILSISLVMVFLARLIAKPLPKMVFLILMPISLITSVGLSVYSVFVA